MTQTPIKKLKTLRNPTAMLVAGASPTILAIPLMFIIRYLTINHPCTEWINYLILHQDTIILSLTVSSVMVAALSTTLHCKTATILAGLQIGLIQFMFISTDPTLDLELRAGLTAIIALPIAILAFRVKS